MIEDGCLDGVDVIYGAHVQSPLENGMVGTVIGPAMATSDNIDIQIRGKGGHGAEPHKTVDPIVIASHLILALQQVAARQTDPLESVVVTIGSVQGGSASNVIRRSCTSRAPFAPSCAECSGPRRSPSSGW